MQRLLSLCAMVLVLGACGGPDGKKNTQSDPIEGQGEARAQLLLFGAPWCTNCKHDFPIVRDRLNQAPAEKRLHLAVKMYVVTGAKVTDRPTAAVANAYRDFFGLSAEAIADPWRWTNFRKYVSDQMDLPGAAILDAESKLLRSFPAGPATFVPQEIVDAALRAAE